MMARWRHFTASEFDCPCCGQRGIDFEFVDKLDDLRERLGFPLIITSGYRCPAHNEKVSTTGRTGPHTTGRAADVGIMGHHAHALLMQASLGGWFTGIGLNQKGEHSKRFIHLDDLQTGPRPNVWTY